MGATDLRPGRIGSSAAMRMPATSAKLPDDQRIVIVLKEYHGLTFREIAELVGCPLSTVKTRLYQGLAVLRRQLARGGLISPAAARSR